MKLSESSTLVDHRSPVYSMHNDTPVVRSTPFKLIASFRTDPAKVEVQGHLQSSLTFIIFIDYMCNKFYDSDNYLDIFYW